MTDDLVSAWLDLARFYDVGTESLTAGPIVDWMDIEPEPRINERKPKPSLHHDTRVAHTTRGGRGCVARLMKRRTRRKQCRL
jgi:hypothetical protein